MQIHWSVPVLQWSDFSQDWMSATVVTEGSDLDRLRVLAERLADDYGWGKDTAAAFVLSDVVPLIQHLTGTSNIKAFGARGRGRLRRRILIEADAWVKPAEVAAAFRKARRDLGVQSAQPLRGLPARLVEFDAGLADDLTWTEKMRRWNTERARNQKEHFNDRRRFALDVNRARDRLGTVLQIGARAVSSTQEESDAEAD